MKFKVDFEKPFVKSQKAEPRIVEAQIDYKFQKGVNSDGTPNPFWGKVVAVIEESRPDGFYRAYKRVFCRDTSGIQEFLFLSDADRKEEFSRFLKIRDAEYPEFKMQPCYF